MRGSLCLLLLAPTMGCSNSDPASVGTSTVDTESTEKSTDVAGFYSVDAYDPSRDASADLTATIARATKERKRIILEVGGLW